MPAEPVGNVPQQQQQPMSGLCVSQFFFFFFFKSHIQALYQNKNKKTQKKIKFCKAQQQMAQIEQQYAANQAQQQMGVGMAGGVGNQQQMAAIQAQHQLQQQPGGQVQYQPYSQYTPQAPGKVTQKEVEINRAESFATKGDEVTLYTSKERGFTFFFCFCFLFFVLFFAHSTNQNFFL